MSAQAGLAAPTAQRLRMAMPALGLGLGLLGLAFHQEVAAAVSVWSVSTAYNHCFLVLPIAAWLVWERRERVAAVAVRPLPWAVLLAAPLTAAWLVAERLGIMEGRQFVALACAELLALTVLGWAMVRAFAAPLTYLVFLVPFGAFLTAPLQGFTAGFVVRGLNLLHIANYSDGYTIEIPEGVFYVAEACAGLRFLIAAVAFGVLYAFTLYHGLLRRVAFVAACVVLAVLANGVRALGIVAAGHWVGSAEAAAADHIIYGWLFFSLVLLLLIVAGLPFRQDTRRQRLLPVPQPDLPGRRMVLAATALGVLAAAGPLLAGGLDRAAARQAVTAPSAIAGCEPSSRVWEQGEAALSDVGATRRVFTCQGGIQVLAVAFPPRTNPMALLAAQRSLTALYGEDVDSFTLQDAEAPGWQGTASVKLHQAFGSALWAGGEPLGSGLRGRLRQAGESLAGMDPAVILLVAEASNGRAVRDWLRRANAAGLSAQMAALTTASQ